MAETLEPKVVTVIQARTGSSRLPNKVMLPILGKPLLLRMIERVQKTKYAGTIVVATTDKKSDDIIYDLCLENGLNIFRGHPTDLLDRHYKAAKIFGADAVVKIPSDCPLIDPAIIDKVIKQYLENTHKYDYISNLHPATYPDGNDVEIMSMKALRTSWQFAKRHFEREHTTPFIWENPDIFSIGNIGWNSGIDLSTTHRWTIDFEEDYLFIKTIYEYLYKTNPNFGMHNILQLLLEKPQLMKINSEFAGKYWYENHLSELNHIPEFKEKLQRVESIDLQ